MNRKIIQIVQFLYLLCFGLVIIIGILYLSLDLSELFINPYTLVPEFGLYMVLSFFIVSLMFHLLSIIYLFKFLIKSALFFGISGDLAALIIISLISQYIVLDYYGFLQTTTVLLFILILMINLSLLILKSGENLTDERIKVKNEILNLQTKFEEVYIKDLSSLCNVDFKNVIRIIRELIQRKEISVTLDRKKLSIKFEIEPELIDQLISKYDDWELEKGEKNE